MPPGRSQLGLSLFARLLKAMGMLAIFFMATPELQAALSPDLFQIWEQTYNEPDETLLAVKEQLRAQEGREDERTATLLAIGAEAASFAENMDDHKAMAEAAIAIAEKHRYMWAWVHAVSAMGIFYEYDGQDAQALAFYQKAIKLAEESNDPELLAAACNNLGYYFARSDRPKESIEVISRALTALHGRPEGVLYHDIINNLALVYTRNEFVGRAEEGRRMLDKSIAYFKERDMRYMTGNNYINLGFFHNRRGEHQTAIDTYIEAIAYSRRMKKTDLLPYYLGQLADTYNTAGRYKEAIEPNEESCRLFKQLKNKAMAAACLLTRALTLVRLKRPEQALDALQERRRQINADASYEENELELEVETEAWHQLGNTKQELEAARRWIKAAQRIYNKNNSRTLQQIAGVLELERKDAENKLLEEKDRTSTLRLQQAERMSRILIGLLGLALVLVGSMIFSVRQSRVIRAQRDRMQEVLDNIEEGILRFGKDFRIRREYSAHVAQILDVPKDLTGQDLFTMLFAETRLSADERSIIRAALANVFDEDEVAWSFNSHQLPLELHRRNRILNLLWQPHYGSQGIDTMLLVIRDVTSNKKLQAEVQATREAAETMTRFMQELLQAQTRPLEHFMKDLESQLQDLTERLAQEATRATSLRQLHTMKGNARSLGLQELAEAVHQVESAHKSEASMPDVCARLIALAAQYAKLYQTMFQASHQTSTTLLSMVDAVQAGILEQLDASRTDFGALVVKDEVGRWPKAWQEPLRVLLLHALTNAVDHGYILPQNKRAVQLRVEAMRSAAGVRLYIRDQGQGISWEALQKLARERQFHPEPGRPLTDLLFDDGVSTSRSLSLSSGRGVGLAAVKEACRELGAVVTLSDNDEGQGTMLVVEIPEGAQALSA